MTGWAELATPDTTNWTQTADIQDVWENHEGGGYILEQFLIIREYTQITAASNIECSGEIYTKETNIPALWEEGV
tara:strand:+ start:1901 stop:2125 length:225 start_codon:yes stop_codon:yes gene_type:complete